MELSTLGGGSGGASGSAATSGSPAQLQKFRRAIAKVRSGGGICRIICVGDSTTAGVGGSTNTTVPAYKGYPADLTTLLNSYRVSAVPGFANPPTTFAGNPDQRWSYGTGWSLNYLGGVTSITSTSPSGNITYADPRINADRFDVYVLTNAGGGLGTVTATATGGSATPFSCSVGGGGVSKFTISAGSLATSNSVTITATGQVFVVGIEPYNSTASTVRIGSEAAGGIQLHGIVGDPTYGGCPLLKALSPDLTIVSAGLNDATNSITAAQYKADLTTLVTAAQVSGDCIIVTPMPSNQNPQTTVIPQYIVQMYAVGAQLGCPVIDLYQRNSSTWDTNLMNDPLHCNDMGYQDWGAAVYDYLASVI